MPLDLTYGHSGQRGGAQFMNFVNEFGLYNHDFVFSQARSEEI